MASGATRLCSAVGAARTADRHCFARRIRWHAVTTPGPAAA